MLAWSTHPGSERRQVRNSPDRRGVATNRHYWPTPGDQHRRTHGSWALIWVRAVSTCEDTPKPPVSPVAGKTIILRVDVLIVAADPGARAIRIVLEALDHTVRVARNADAALRIAASRLPDRILVEATLAGAASICERLSTLGPPLQMLEPPTGGWPRPGRREDSEGSGPSGSGVPSPLLPLVPMLSGAIEAPLRFDDVESSA